MAGLYVITDPTLTARHPLPLPEMVEQALRGGARLVQYRNKTLPADQQQQEAEAVLVVCRQYQVPLLVNDDVALAERIGADGVHLGQSDIGMQEARKKLGPHAIIGITCHNRLDLARRAQREGADYVAFGRFFPSQTKPEAPAATLDVLQRAKAELNIPIVAIGGISPDNGASLIAAGADMLAVIHGVFGQQDIKRAAAAYARLFTAE